VATSLAVHDAADDDRHRRLAVSMGGGLWGFKMWRLSRFYASEVKVSKAFENTCVQAELSSQSRAQELQARRSWFIHGMECVSILCARIILHGFPDA
jgi:hypothetical protein